MKLWDWLRWQWCGQAIVSEMKLIFTLFSKDTKLESIVQVPWKMPKKPFVIEDNYKGEDEFIEQQFDKHEKKIRKRSLEELKKAKNKKWQENKRQMFPSKYLIGIEWYLEIKTRNMTFEEWKKTNKDEVERQ